MPSSSPCKDFSTCAFTSTRGIKSGPEAEMRAQKMRRQIRHRGLNAAAAAINAAGDDHESTESATEEEEKVSLEFEDDAVGTFVPT
mmetsp:Transcript_45859/g.139287  ORF Transcript_45859/g.139287 Transcript_45859/m.139287 type:complete len:86 (-) Transcript_45859:78-335(-)